MATKIIGRASSLGAALLVGLLVLTGCPNPNCIKGEGEVETRTLALSSIREVEVNGNFKVFLTQGAQQQVEVKGEPNILNELRTEVQNEKWRIDFRSCIRRHTPVEVYITMPQVRSLYLNGSGSVVGQNKIEASNLTVGENGSGVVDLEMAATKLIANKNGSGELHFRGQAEEVNLTMTGSGKAALSNLQGEDVQVRLTGSGTAEVAASHSLSVDLDGSGTVYFSGNPTLSKHITGSGKVVKR